MAKANKFTFKCVKEKGRYSAFTKGHHTIKYRKLVCGSIIEERPFRIRLMVHKDDINEDGNPNCPWKWISLKKESESLQEAKDWLNENIEEVLAKYPLRFSED
jgi:hypothetical protein